MKTGTNFSRRRFMATSASAIAASVPFLKPSDAFSSDSPIEIVHWSPLSASDGEVWQAMIDAFNKAHEGKGVSIRMEVVPYDQYNTKVLTSVATGRAPDFGWGDAGERAGLVKDGVVVPMDEYVAEVGLDLGDFDPSTLDASKYPKYGPELYSIPMDVMSLQPEINLDHVAEAGLPMVEGPNDGPQDGDELIEWAKAMTKLDGDSVARSGIMMTATGPHPTVTWGIVADQLGFGRTNADFTEAVVNPDAGLEAMEWVLALFDEHKVATRDISDRYRAFGNSEGSIFWTGPWTLNGYIEQGLNFASFLMPQIGRKRSTFFAMGGLEMYKQSDPARYSATMAAIKWLSDNGFLWTTTGRGVSPRISTRAQPEYMQAGHPWKVRGAFVEGLKFATIKPIPVPTSIDYSIYGGTNFLASVLDEVWAKQATPAEAMDRIRVRWQRGLDRA